MKGENCRSGCRTRDHDTYGQCLRDASPRVTLAATPHNAWDRELNFYKSAREQGIQPSSTKTADIQKALDISDSTGVAYGK